MSLHRRRLVSMCNICFSSFLNKTSRKTSQNSVIVTGLFSFSIDVFWSLPWRWNDSTRVFTNMLFLFLGHVKSYSFWACTMLFWTFHLGRAKRLSWPNRVKPLAMRHKICCFVHFLVTFHFGRMNVFGVCSSFFHACCSEAQNSETLTILHNCWWPCQLFFCKVLKKNN